MKRANIKAYKLTYENVYLIETLDDLIEYNDTIKNSKIQEAAKEIIETLDGHKRHLQNRLGDVACTISKIKRGDEGGGELIELCNLEGKVTANQYLHIIKGKKLAINVNDGYFTIPEDAIIELIKDFKYTEKDIRISKFDTGKHYYAKIGDVEVIDQWGDNKWNTYQFAYNTALIYLNQLNKNEEN